MFLKSYFSDRLLYTNISDSTSNILSVRYGMVQGSTLGPLMFLVYINDTAESSRILKFTLCAGDTSVFLSGGELNILISTLNGELKLIDKWFTVNKLTLNSSMSEFMIFHSR